MDDKLMALVGAATATEPPMTVPASVGAGAFSHWLRTRAALRDLAPELAIIAHDAVEALRIVHPQTRLPCIAAYDKLEAKIPEVPRG